MAKNLFRGDAVAISQVTRVTPGTITPGHTYSLKINSKLITVTAASDDVSDLLADLVDAISGSSIPEFQEVTVDQEDGALILTGSTAGVPFTVTALAGGFETDEYQVITIANATGGTFPLTYHYLDSLGIEQTETIASIAISATAATLKSTLEGLTHIGSGNVDVTGPAGGPWQIRFQNALGRTDILPLTTSRASLTGGDAVLSVSITQTAIAGTNEVQTITFYGLSAGSGTFVAGFRGVFTAPITWPPSAATFQAAMRLLSSINGANITITGSAGGPYTATFIGALAHQAVPNIEIDARNLVGTIGAAITTTTPGVAGQNTVQYLEQLSGGGSDEVFTIKRSGTVSGGTFRWTYASGFSAVVNWDGRLHQMISALEALIATAEGSSYNGPYFAAYTPGTENYTMSDGGGTLRIVCLGTAGGRDVTFISGIGISSALTGGGNYAAPSTGGSDGHWTGGNLASSGGMVLRIGASGTPTNPITLSLDSFGFVSSTMLALITAEFEALPEVGAGNVLVTLWPALPLSNGSARGLFRLEFIGALAGAYVAPITGYQSGLPSSGDSWAPRAYMLQGGIAGTNEVQQLAMTGSPSHGGVTVNYRGADSAQIVYNATAAAADAIVEAMSTVGAGNFLTAGGALPGTPLTFTASGTFIYQDLPEMTVNDSALKVQVAETTPGVTGRNQKQRVSIAGQDVWGGTLTLTAVGDTTGSIQWNDTVDTVLVLLIATSGIGPSDITGTGGPFPDAAMDFEFTGALAEANQTQITGTTTALKNGTINIESYDPMIVDTITEASGPNHWNDKANWTLNHVPYNADDVVLSEGDTDILHGLRQVSTFTVDTVNDQVIPDGHDFVIGQMVRVWTSGTYPSPLAANTDYYVIAIDSVSRRVKLATTATGTTINLTTAGSGTLYIGSRPQSFFQDARYGGEIGLPQWNSNGYWENRPRYLKLGIDQAGSKSVIIGQGEGRASGLVRLDFGNDQINGEVLNATGSAESGTPAVNILNVNAASVWTVYQGEVGIAFFADEVSTINQINSRGGRTTLGNVTLAAIDRTGGEVLTKDSATLNGVLRLRG